MKPGMDASREAFEWRGIPAEGELLTYLPAFPGFLPVVFSPSGERAFVPITAARQRGFCTPLPRYHPLIYCLVLLAPQLEGVNTILTPDNNI
jgi:hypothetical protein